MMGSACRSTPSDLWPLSRHFDARLPSRPSIDAHGRIDTIRKGEDAGFSRRSLRLLCGDWLPHDDGASEVCPTLATDISVGAVQNKLGDSLYRVGVLAAADREACRP
jgi:hypothetical protein